MADDIMPVVPNLRNNEFKPSSNNTGAILKEGSVIKKTEAGVKADREKAENNKIMKDIIDKRNASASSNGSPHNSAHSSPHNGGEKSGNDGKADGKSVIDGKAVIIEKPVDDGVDRSFSGMVFRHRFKIIAILIVIVILLIVVFVLFKEDVKKATGYGSDKKSKFCDDGGIGGTCLKPPHDNSPMMISSPVSVNGQPYIPKKEKLVYRPELDSDAKHNSLVNNIPSDSLDDVINGASEDLSNKVPFDDLKNKPIPLLKPTINSYKPVENKRIIDDNIEDDNIADDDENTNDGELLKQKFNNEEPLSQKYEENDEVSEQGSSNKQSVSNNSTINVINTKLVQSPVEIIKKTEPKKKSPLANYSSSAAESNSVEDDIELLSKVDNEKSGEKTIEKCTFILSSGRRCASNHAKDSDKCTRHSKTSSN